MLTEPLGLTIRPPEDLETWSLKLKKGVFSLGVKCTSPLAD